MVVAEIGGLDMARVMGLVTARFYLVSEMVVVEMVLFCGLSRFWTWNGHSLTPEVARAPAPLTGKRRCRARLALGRHRMIEREEKKLYGKKTYKNNKLY